MFCRILLQRDGSALASASGLCGNRVSVFGSPEISLCVNRRKLHSISARALRQLPERSSSVFTDSVSRANFFEFLNASMYWSVLRLVYAIVPSTLTKVLWYGNDFSAQRFNDFGECGRRWCVRRVYWILTVEFVTDAWELECYNALWISSITGLPEVWKLCACKSMRYLTFKHGVRCWAFKNCYDDSGAFHKNLYMFSEGDLMRM